MDIWNVSNLSGRASKTDKSLVGGCECHVRIGGVVVVGRTELHRCCSGETFRLAIAVESVVYFWLVVMDDDERKEDGENPGRIHIRLT